MRDILESFTSSELKKEISKTNIKGYSKLKKEELINLMLKNKDRFLHLKKKDKKALAPKKAKGVLPPAKPKINKDQQAAKLIKLLLLGIKKYDNNSFSKDQEKKHREEINQIIRKGELNRGDFVENYKMSQNQKEEVEKVLRGLKIKLKNYTPNLEKLDSLHSKLSLDFFSKDNKKKEPEKKVINEIGEKLIVLPETNANNKILNKINKINFQENKKQFKSVEEAFEEKKRLQNIARQKKKEENKKLKDLAKKLLEKDSPKTEKKEMEKSSNIKTKSELLNNFMSAKIEDLKLVQSKSQYDAMIKRIKSGKGKYTTFYTIDTLRTFDKDFVRELFEKYSPSQLKNAFSKMVKSVAPEREVHFPKDHGEVAGHGFRPRDIKILVDKLPYRVENGKVYKTFKEYNNRFDKK